MKNHDESEEDMEKKVEVISGDSPVRLGLIIAILCLIAGGFGASIWWAATVSTKLDSVLLMGTKNETALADLKHRLDRIELIGSDALQKHIQMDRERGKVP